MGKKNCSWAEIHLPTFIPEQCLEWSCKSLWTVDL